MSAPSPIFTRRLQKELRDLMQSPSQEMRVEDASNLTQWFIIIGGAPGTLYEGEQFRLRFRFPTNYPMDSPEVVFVGTAPVHPHIYSNGHICLSILYDSWSPALTTQSVCLSILSMLSSAAIKELPPNNDSYVAQMGNRSPKQTSWSFHDDRC